MSLEYEHIKLENIFIISLVLIVESYSVDVDTRTSLSALLYALLAALLKPVNPPECIAVFAPVQQNDGTIRFWLEQPLLNVTLILVPI